MVCETGKVSGLAGVIADQKASIKEKESEKKHQTSVCESSYDTYENLFVAYREANSKAHLSNLTKQEKEKKLEELRLEMKMQIANASKNGKSQPEINALKMYYEDLIFNLELNIASYDRENKQANLASTDAESAKQHAKFNWIGATNWFQDICHTLFNDYISLGNLQRTYNLGEMIAKNNSQSSINKRFDVTT